EEKREERLEVHVLTDAVALVTGLQNEGAAQLPSVAREGSARGTEVALRILGVARPRHVDSYYEIPHTDQSPAVAPHPPSVRQVDATLVGAGDEGEFGVPADALRPLHLRTEEEQIVGDRGVGVGFGGPKLAACAALPRARVTRPPARHPALAVSPGQAVIGTWEIGASRKLREKEVSDDTHGRLPVVRIHNANVTELAGGLVTVRDIPGPFLADLRILQREGGRVEGQAGGSAYESAVLEEPRLTGELSGALREKVRRRVAAEARPQLEAHAVEEEKATLLPHLGRQEGSQRVELLSRHHL